MLARFGALLSRKRFIRLILITHSLLDTFSFSSSFLFQDTFTLAAKRTLFLSFQGRGWVRSGPTSLFSSASKLLASTGPSGRGRSGKRVAFSVVLRREFSWLPLWPGPVACVCSSVPAKHSVPPAPACFASLSFLEEQFQTLPKTSVFSQTARYFPLKVLSVALRCFRDGFCPGRLGLVGVWCLSKRLYVLLKASHRRPMKLSSLSLFKGHPCHILK